MAESGDASLPDSCFMTLRVGGRRWAADPGNSYRNALRFLRFPISVMLYAPHCGRMTTIPKTRLRGLFPQTPFSASRRFEEGLKESGDALLPDSCFDASRWGRRWAAAQARLRGLSPQTPFFASRRFEEGLEESGDASLPDSCFCFSMGDDRAAALRPA